MTLTVTTQWVTTSLKLAFIAGFTFFSKTTKKNTKFRSHGGDLVSVHSPQQEENILKIIKKAETKTPASYYLGFSDRGSDTGYQECF